jgi:hypothetical protein
VAGRDRDCGNPQWRKYASNQSPPPEGAEAIEGAECTLADMRSNMLSAITSGQVKEVIDLVKRWSDARKARTAVGQTQSTEEIMHDPVRRQLTDYLYALSNEGRGQLIALMLLGRGDFDHSYENVIEARIKYTSADDQVAYLISKTVRLAEYLRIGLDAIERSD